VEWNVVLVRLVFEMIHHPNVRPLLQGNESLAQVLQAFIDWLERQEVSGFWLQIKGLFLSFLKLFLSNVGPRSLGKLLIGAKVVYVFRSIWVQNRTA
jgi:hypothetical protein